MAIAAATETAWRLAQASARSRPRGGEEPLRRPLAESLLGLYAPAEAGLSFRRRRHDDTLANANVFFFGFQLR